MKINLNQVLSYIFLFIILIIVLFPLVWIGSMAFKTNFEIFKTTFSLPKKMHWENIITVWTVGQFSKYLLNSVIVTIPVVLGVLLVTSLAAYGLTIMDLPGKNYVFIFFLFGLMAPIQAIMIPLYYDLTKYGLINTFSGLTLVEISYLGIPFGIFLLRQFFITIPRDLISAARIDGCSDIQILYKIVLPISKPAVSALIVIIFMYSWNEFLLPLMLLQDSNLRTLPLGLVFLQGGKYTLNYSQIAGGVLIAALPIMIVYLLFQRKFVQGITAGSLK